MQVFQNKIISKDISEGFDMGFTPDILFLFASKKFVGIEELVQNLNALYQDIAIIGCSTAGEILGDQLFDDTVALTAVKFESTTIKTAKVDLDSCNRCSFGAGLGITQQLEEEGLRHIFVLSDGLSVNGAELVKGIQNDLPKGVSVTGGLAGDGFDFDHTFVIYNKGIFSKNIIAVGFYGDALKIGYGSNGGWDSFGVERLVTKSDKNVLYELDGQPALELYKSYLGDKAADLPGSGLLFPLSMRDEDNEIPVVRTILGVNEKDQSVTFAGSIPQGAYVRLMKANIDRIIQGAEKSAEISKQGSSHKHELAFLISCVGRRLLMKQLVEEEIEAVNEVYDNNIFTTGFYSYGEIAPFDKSSACALHNQTMTITTLSE